MVQRIQFPRLDLNTPVGRLVAGNVAVPNPNDMNGKPRDKPQYWFGLAVAKTDPAIGPLIQQIMQHAWTSYQTSPAVLQRLQHGLAAPEFAWKIQDGDAQKFAGREGYAGHWVFGFGTALPIRCAMNLDGAENKQIDPAAVKLGWYADVAFSIEINGKQDHTAGLFMNPSCCRILGYGPVITPGPSINQLMGARPAVLPPGASLTPLAPAGGAVPALPGVPALPAALAPAPAFNPAPVQPGGLLPPTVSMPQAVETAEQVAAKWGVQHHAGYRYDPASNTYQTDAQPAPTPPPVPAMPQGQFVTPSPVRPPSAAEIAVQYRVQHHEGYRYNPVTNAYEPDTAGNPPAPVAVPVAPAGAIGHPVQPIGAPSFQATASPINPHPQFLHGGLPR